MPWTNYHGHCHYCDGKLAPEAYVEQALARDFAAYGFSSHAPAPIGKLWTMRPERLEAYCAEILHLREQYRGQIEIYLGLELDYLPGVAKRSEAMRAAGVEYMVGSVHVGGELRDGSWWEFDGGHQQFLKGVEEIFEGDIRAAIGYYYELHRRMIHDDRPEIVGHMDKVKIQSENGLLFQENEPWYRDAVLETLEHIRQSGSIVEVSTRGIVKKLTSELYPSRWILEELLRMGIPVTISSDTHHPDDVDALFPYAAQALLDIGFTHTSVLFHDQWQQAALSPEGLHL